RYASTGHGAPCPYTIIRFVLSLLDKQNGMKMIRHDDERIKDDVRADFGGSQPLGLQNLPKRVCPHYAIHHLPKQRPPLMRTHCYKIPALAPIIEGWQSNRPAVWQRFRHDDLLSRWLEYSFAGNSDRVYLSPWHPRHTGLTSAAGSCVICRRSLPSALMTQSS